MKTLKAGLIGAHISQTRLPKALKIMCDEAGIALDFTLTDTAKRPDFDFTARINRARFEGYTGITITHPWKTHARKLIGDNMQTDVAHLGACNTITLGAPDQGYNTDYTGFLKCFQDFGHAPGRVILMGAGGVAEAIAPALMAMGATDIAICDLAAPRANALAHSCGARVIQAEDVPDEIATADGLVNATPLGMPDYPGTAFDPAWLGPQTWAFDAVYTPTNTMFLRDCAAAGLVCLTGFDLFRAMAVRSFEAYTGLHIDDAAIRAKLDSLEPE